MSRFLVPLFEHGGHIDRKKLYTLCFTKTMIDQGALQLRDAGMLEILAKGDHAITDLGREMYEEAKEVMRKSKLPKRPRKKKAKNPKIYDHDIVSPTLTMVTRMNWGTFTNLAEEA